MHVRETQYSMATWALTLLAGTALAGCLGDGAGASAGAGEPHVLPSGPYINPDRSLLVRDQIIVDDPSRTFDPCANGTPDWVDPYGPYGWTFGYLMTHMANPTLTSTTPKATVVQNTQTFAHNWLANWALTTVVNGDPLEAKKALCCNRYPDPLEANDAGCYSPACTTPPCASSSCQYSSPKSLAMVIYDAWQRASGGTTGGTVKLAMNKAPFRLLAIVNRFDLRNNRRFGEGISGELRFVFSVVNLDEPQGALAPNGNATCKEYAEIKDVGTPGFGVEDGARGNQFVILEYAVDSVDDNAKRLWAQQWRDLTFVPFDDPSFATTLQALTETVVRAGQGGSLRPNRSALIRLRTNETADRLVWDLREFNINSTTGYLTPTTVKQSPANALNGTPDLGKWINDNSGGIPDTYVVPNTFPTTDSTGYRYANKYFLGSHSSLRTGSTFWNSTAIINDFHGETRHQFSQNTCSGCHSAETGNLFFQVHGRPYGETSILSTFLNGDGNGGPVDVPDPAGISPPRPVYELGNRAADLSDYLNGLKP